jgi:hypothetical protein
MGTSSRTLLLLALALALLVQVSDGSTTIRQPITARVWERASPGDSLEFHLADRWIRSGSILVLADAETLSTDQYSIELTEGILRLKRPLSVQRLRVQYEVVPLAIGRVFQSIIPPDKVGPSRTPIPPSRGGKGGIAGPARLELRGSKTVSLEVGTAQDLTVRQSLDVSLSGEIVDGVTVRGVLSDRQTPLQAEGRTTELSDLDRIYLQVDGPGASMTLGDFQLRGPSGLFSGYERQLEGIVLKGIRGPGQVMLAAASVPGEFVTVDFLAEEGKQGPYLLRSPSATFDAAVLAGTETVWLDGDRLIRGEDRDYTIDYAAAELTFTGRRPVTKDSRITVDYQISSQPFRRNAFAAAVAWGSAADPRKKGFGLRASLFSERDDEGSPFGGDLTDREKQILRAAGDSLTVDLESGVDCGEQGEGDYELVEADSLNRPFFRYVGPDSGTCRVRFDDVGNRNGDYADSVLSNGDRIFRFVGFRQGSFQPGRAVPRPTRRDLLDLAGSWTGPSGIRCDLEAAGSYDDPNTFSSRDDGDRTGGALYVRIDRETLPVRLANRSIGRWGLTVESRDRDSRFRSMGRIDPSWYGYEWGISGTRLQAGDRRRSAEIRHEPGFGLALSGTFETLSNRRDLEGERTRWRLRRSGTIYGAFERLRGETRDRSSGETVDGGRNIDDLRLGLRTRKLEGSVGHRRERDVKGTSSDRIGSGFDEWSIRTAYLIGGENGRVELSRTERQDRLAAGGDWTDGDVARTWVGKVSFNRAGRLLEMQYTRRDLFRDSGGRSRSDLASLLWSQNQAGGKFGQQIRADLNTSEEEGRVKSIEFVGENQGRYDSLGVFIGTGDYDLVLIPTGKTQLQRRMDVTWRIDLAPGRGSGSVTTGWEEVWMTSQWLLYATFSSRTTGSAAAFWQALPKLLLAREENVPLAAHKIRAEGSTLPGARWLSPRFGYRRERSRETLFENVQTARRKDLYSLTLRSLPKSGWTLEQEIEFDQDKEETSLLSRESSFGAVGWRSLRIGMGAWWRPVQAWTLRINLADRLRERIPSQQQFAVIQLSPALQWVPRSRTRVDLRATRTWINGASERILGLETPGWEGRGNFSIRLHGSLDATLITEFRAPDGSKSRTSARAELRALF